LAGQFARLLGASGVRVLAAASLTTFGVWTIVAALAHVGHH
jgi:hypothetical protein